MGTDGATTAPGTGTYAAVNGPNLYYETHGAGRALLLLHGGLGSGAMFGPILPALAARHRVIAVDLHGHGRTADIDRPLDVRLMADDVAALIDHLGLDRPAVVGFSLRGGVAFRTAAQHPDRVGRLVMASAHIRSDAVYPELRRQQGQVSAVAEAFLRDKIGAAMARDFDFSADVRALRVPTLIVCADADMAPPGHYVEVFALLNGGLRDGGWTGEHRPRGGHALAILPGLTHYNLVDSPLFATVLDFLNEHAPGSAG